MAQPRPDATVCVRIPEAPHTCTTPPACLQSPPSFCGLLPPSLVFLDQHPSCRRLVVLEAARALDEVGNKAARGQIAAAKALAPTAALRIIDRAIQVLPADSRAGTLLS